MRINLITETSRSEAIDGFCTDKKNTRLQNSGSFPDPWPATSRSCAEASSSILFKTKT
jgi:hypothetical protein